MLLDSGILYSNSEVGVLNDSGETIFLGMAWEMDDDILNLHLKHILSVYDSGKSGRVWIETTDHSPLITADLCEKYNCGNRFCANCKLTEESCWKKRQKSSHGGFVHEETSQYGQVHE